MASTLPGLSGALPHTTTPDTQPTPTPIDDYLTRRTTGEPLYPAHPHYSDRPLYFNGCRCVDCRVWYALTYQ